MDAINIINVAPLFAFAKDILAILGFFTIIGIGIFLLYSRKNISQFVRLNERTIYKLLEDNPLVEREFITQDVRLQNIKNNQLIHEQLLEIEELKRKLRINNTQKIYFRSSYNDN